MRNFWKDFFLTRVSVTTSKHFRMRDKEHLSSNFRQKHVKTFIQISLFAKY